MYLAAPAPSARPSTPPTAARSVAARYVHGDGAWYAVLGTDRLHELPPLVHATSAQPRALPARVSAVPPTAITCADVLG